MDVTLRHFRGPSWPQVQVRKPLMLCVVGVDPIELRQDEEAFSSSEMPGDRRLFDLDRQPEFVRFVLRRGGTVTRKAELLDQVLED